MITSTGAGHPIDSFQDVYIGQDQVTSPADAAAKIRAAEHAKKSSVPVLIVRDGTPQFLALALNGAAGQAG